MPEIGDAFLDRARESLAGAESEYANARYNNAANRSYYACYQAAIAALERAGVRPPGSGNDWGHGSVQAQFTGLLVNRRKLYPTGLRDVLNQTLRTRVQADYKTMPVSEVQAARALRRAREFVAAVGTRTGATG